jgi:hypothetical protein
MNTLTVDTRGQTAPLWLWGAGALGLAWNVFGLYQYVGTFTPAGQAAMTAGMTAEQAALYLGLPAWISVVFAVGVVGGLLGSVALLARRGLAKPVFTASFVGYLLLFAGDMAYGVFAAIPSQLAILAVVVLIAGALLWASRVAGRQGLLR